MKKLIIISIFSLFIFSCGENIIEEVVERYDDGKFKKVEYYKSVGDNQEKVKYRLFFSNGQIEKEENYKSGKLDGEWIHYYEDGQLREKLNFKGGKKNGKNFICLNKVNIQDYPEFDYIFKIHPISKPESYFKMKPPIYIIETNYKDDKLDGELILKHIYQDNEDIISKLKYKSGKLDGKWIDYWCYMMDCNGDIKYERNYIDGKLDGEYIYYYQNGQKIKEENYIDGILVDGEYIRYDRYGFIWEIYNMKNEKLEGLRRSYYSRSLHIEEYYENGLLHGLCNQYVPVSIDNTNQNSYYEFMMNQPTIIEPQTPLLEVRNYNKGKLVEIKRFPENLDL